MNEEITSDSRVSNEECEERSGWSSSTVHLVEVNGAELSVEKGRTLR